MQNKFNQTPKMLRSILGLDRPLKILSAAEADVARQKNLRWNIAFNSVDVIFFMGGLSLLSATTILPLFISKLSDSTVPLAILAMIAQGGFFLPSLFTANFIERLDHKKPMVVNIGFFTERLPLLLLTFTPFFALRFPFLALVLFLLLYAWFSLGGGVIAPAWQDMIARCFPAHQRGRFFGTNMFIGTILGAGAASWAGFILDDVPFPNSFVWIFGAGALGILFSWVGLIPVREPIEAGKSAVVPMRDYLAELPALLRSDPNYRNFLIARAVISLAEMGTGFLTVAAIQTWDISDGTVAQFTTAMLVGQTAGSLLMGFLSDRYGHRLTLELAMIALSIAFACAWLANGPLWYFAVFFLMGIFMGAKTVSGMLVVLEFSAPEKRPTYSGIASTIAGVFSMIAPIIGGGLAVFGYSWLFMGSTLVSVLGVLLLHFSVREPRFKDQELVSS